MKNNVILVTGFCPFLEQEKNSSEEAVKLLPDQVGGCRIEKRLADGSREGMWTAEKSGKALLYCLEEFAKTLIRPVRTLEEYRESL